MSYYAKIKKLDEESLRRLTEGSGPADECLCSILSPPEVKKGFTASVKKVFGALSGRKKGIISWGQGSREMQQSFSKDPPGFHSTKEVVQRQKPCGKCGCDSDKFVLKHSYANIRITTPDVSTICPCSSDCLPDKEKLQNNIKVIVENVQINSKPNFEKEPNIEDSQALEHHLDLDFETEN
ncbi:uncharacterized protein [Maniola hyperantus]|uniref:uncharacterized protein n=1 Tax=Aphantopus hyperantus TaxID=2795564 RepID=UPI0015684845|nr:uncharacterized protein LOC117994278 [Maniola hyperantus]